MLIEHEAGRRPINRARNWQEETRKKQKVKKKTGWFKTGGFSTVIFCPFTPGSELAKKWRAIEAKDAEIRGWRYKVFEQSGRQVRSIVCKNPGLDLATTQRCFRLENSIFCLFHAFLALFGLLYGFFGPFLTLFNEKNIIFSPFRKKFPGKA